MQKICPRGLTCNVNFNIKKEIHREMCDPGKEYNKLSENVNKMKLMRQSQNKCECFNQKYSNSGVNFVCPVLRFLESDGEFDCMGG